MESTRFVLPALLGERSVGGKANKGGEAFSDWVADLQVTNQPHRNDYRQDPHYLLRKPI
jgi:hypothetical protein